MPPKKSTHFNEYIAVNELRYPHVGTGEEIHVKPGEPVHNIAESSLVLEIEDGNVRVLDVTVPADKATVRAEPVMVESNAASKETGPAKTDSVQVVESALDGEEQS